MGAQPDYGPDPAAPWLRPQRPHPIGTSRGQARKRVRAVGTHGHTHMLGHTYTSTNVHDD